MTPPDSLPQSTCPGETRHLSGFLEGCRYRNAGFPPCVAIPSQLSAVGAHSARRRAGNPRRMMGVSLQVQTWLTNEPYATDGISTRDGRIAGADPSGDGATHPKRTTARHPVDVRPR